MPKGCETCKHFVVKYSPIYHGLVETCEFTSRNNGCAGQYEAKENRDVKKK